MIVRARMTVGPPLCSTRRLVRRVNLARIVPAEPQTAQRIVVERFDKLEQTRIAAEETLSHVCAGFDHQLLVFAVDQFAHALDEQAVGVARQNRIPLGAPQNLDDVPARAAERRFEFLNNLPVTAHRTIESLQVAVDDEDQIVELFARRQA